MYRIVLFQLVLCFFFVGCYIHEERITNPVDYALFLELSSNEKIKSIDEELKFWKGRLEKTPDDIVSRSKIASLLSKRFARSGNIREIHQADSLYQLVLPLNRNYSSGTYRSLANICISQHQFREAKAYLDSALNLGDDKYLTLLMVFDVAMELGNYARAKEVLHSFGNDHSFEILIRKSKFKDHVEGNQKEAIQLLEKAYGKIKGQGYDELETWTKSNLGDMYSHANRFREAYQSYLDVLRIDPGYHHSLKGIGWIALSKDGDFDEAKKIFECILKQHPGPDYLLMLAEISGLQNRKKESKYYYDRFLKEATNPLYGDMFNKYLCHVLMDIYDNYDQALRLAEREVNIRPTPESYNLLAWVHYRKGNLKQAEWIARTSVENQCFEPEALYHLGMINLTLDKKKARKYLQLASESATELGPVIAKEIESAINQL